MAASPEAGGERLPRAPQGEPPILSPNGAGIIAAGLYLTDISHPPIDAFTPGNVTSFTDPSGVKVQGAPQATAYRVAELLTRMEPPLLVKAPEPEAPTTNRRPGRPATKRYLVTDAGVNSLMAHITRPQVISTGISEALRASPLFKSVKPTSSPDAQPPHGSELPPGWANLLAAGYYQTRVQAGPLDAFTPKTVGSLTDPDDPNNEIPVVPQSTAYRVTLAMALSGLLLEAQSKATPGRTAKRRFVVSPIGEEALRQCLGPNVVISKPLTEVLIDYFDTQDAATAATTEA